MLSEQVSRKYQLLLISTVLVSLILVAFEPIRHNDFIYYDDNSYITRNHYIQSGLTFQSVIWAFTSGYASNWHPLTWLSHMVDIELFGLNPLGHHLHNLILHIAATVLLFVVLHKMTGAVWCSAFAAMVFGIHPLHVESVAWAAERKDVLSALFWMLTLLAYFYYVKRGGTVRYLLVVFCFALGLMAKPMLVTLPLNLLLLDFWPLGRMQKSTGRSCESPECNLTENYRSMSFLRLLTEKIPLFALALIVCIVTYKVQQSSGSMTKIEAIPWLFRISNAIISDISYLGKMFWPSNLALLYPLPTHQSLRLFIAAVLILTVISSFVIIRLRRQPYLATGWFWYIVSLIPVIGLIQVGIQRMADRYMYLPSVGITIMFTWVVAHFSLRWRYHKIILAVLSGIVAVAMTVGTRTQVNYWKNSTTLFEHTLSITQDNYMIHYYMGWAQFKQKNLNEAVAHLKASLQIQPAFMDGYLTMADLLIEQERFDEAMNYLHKALELEPKNSRACYCTGVIFQSKGQYDEAINAYEQAIRFDRNNAEAFNDLGILKSRKGLFKEAAECFRQSIHSNPSRADTYRNLGVILQEQNQIDEAIANYRIALQIDPKNYQTCWCLASIQHLSGNLREAVNGYRQTLSLKPDFLMAMNNLAWVLCTTSDDKIRDPNEAIQLARKACELTSFKDIHAMNTLAAAYASANRFQVAIETAQKAIDLAKTAGQIEMIQEIEKWLQLYQTGKPYYEPSSK